MNANAREEFQTFVARHVFDEINMLRGEIERLRAINQKGESDRAELGRLRGIIRKLVEAGPSTDAYGLDDFDVWCKHCKTYAMYTDDGKHVIVHPLDCFYELIKREFGGR